MQKDKRFSPKFLAAAGRDAAGSLEYSSMPLTLLLFRYLWPFWLLRDASRGDRMARAAAYRHNRGMRVYLPGYLLKWVVCCALMLQLTTGLDSLSDGDSLDVFQVMAAGTGMAFACGVCVLVMTGYVYLYLTHNRD